MQLSNKAWNLSRIAEASAPLEKAFADFLGAVIAQPSVHARFLNMLSLLEYIGSRKIMLSQSKCGMPAEALQHLAEETRHAAFFKHHAGKMAGGVPEDYTDENTMARAAAAMYFGRLDAAISNALPAGGASAYLWVSMIIELRASWVYTRYQNALKAAAHPLSLKPILAEENLHLKEMAEKLEALGADLAALVPVFASEEQRLFHILFKALQDDVALAHRPPAQAA